MSRWDNKRVGIEALLGKVLTMVIPTEDMIIFHTADNEMYRMLHYNDCCEHVSIESVTGDWNDLIGLPILLAEESSNSDNPKNEEYPAESFTWTFYKLATNKGYVDIRWYGSSNGYYSESVDFELVTKE